MKAVICEAYGPPEVLKIVDVEKPKPKSGEVLVKVRASSVNSGDVRIRALRVDGALAPVIKVVMRLLVGITRPRKIMGAVLAGVIEEIGADVKKFKVGDEVFALTGFKFGGQAEYAAVPASKAIARKPKKASFEQAAAIPFGGTTALYFLNKAGIDQAKKVLVYGSTGAVGTAAVQIARIKGAIVTAVCGADGLKLSKKLGAKNVYDYSRQQVADLPEKFDIIFDAVGKTSKKECVGLLEDGGVFVTVAGLDVSQERASDLEELAVYYDRGEFVAVIDKTFLLGDIVEANRYVDTGHKKGNVVVRIPE